RPAGLSSVSPIGFFLDTCHYNFSTSEICHYNSPILKLVIIILHFFESCHFIRLRDSWTHTPTHVFSYGPKYPYCFSPFNSLTCGPHTSVSSSTSGLRPTRLTSDLPRRCRRPAPLR